MRMIKLDVLEKNCPKCNGTGKLEVYPAGFWATVDDLEDKNYPSTQEAKAEARSIHQNEIKSETCDHCKGKKLVPNINGKTVLMHKEEVLEFIDKYKDQVNKK
jgi:excinuclease UvrABC ATPase subunit